VYSVLGRMLIVICCTAAGPRDRHSFCHDLPSCSILFATPVLLIH